MVLMSAGFVMFECACIRVMLQPYLKTVNSYEMSFSFVTFALKCRGDGLNNEILTFPVVKI